ncbi:MAG: prepilin peptidase [Solirubrobacterales bacterium]
MAPAAALALAFLGGLIAGSAVTAIAHRVPRGLSLAGPRSACPACGAQISARDNLPVVSWLLLHGRARCCGEPIPARYPLAELGLGVVFVATVAVHWGAGAEIALDLVFATMLAAVTLTDLDQRIIPTRILLGGAAVGLAIVGVSDPASIGERAIAAAAAGGLLFLAALAYPAGMGLGDVKLAAVMGLYLGRSVAPAIFVALLAGSLVGIALIVRHGAARGRKMAIPFGPFLALGGVVAMLAGPQLIDLYLG